MKLITGHRGFIGYNLYKKLASLGINCVGIEKDDALLLIKNDSLESYLTSFGINEIFHIGAITDTLYTSSDIYLYNTLFSRKIFDAAQKLKIKVVYSSSAAVCGVPENAWPQNHYAWSKYLSEISNPFISLRYFNVYGPNEEHKGHMASIAYQAWRKNREKSIFKLFAGSDDHKRDFIYVDDVVNANIIAMNSDIVGVFDVGTGQPISFKEMLDFMKINYVISDENPPVGYQKYTRACEDKFLPGWTPEFMPKEGIEKYRKYLEFRL